MQEGSLLNTFHCSELVKIEDDFNQSKLHVHNSALEQQALEVKYDDRSSHGSILAKAWDNFRVCFSHLNYFCISIATFFPGTAIIESDVSALQWEKNSSRNGFVDLSIKGIMRCKQHSKISCLSPYMI